MDIQIKSESFKLFLERCSVGGIIKDLVIHTTSNNSIMAKFGDKSGTLYGEVYSGGVKITTEGNIKIPNLKKITSIIDQCESDIIRIKSSDDAFVITDGNTVGKFNVNILQTSDAEIVESYDPIKEVPNMFDKDVLAYADGKINYANGCSIPVEKLKQILKDSSAFGYEIFKLEVAKNVLKCKIECNQTGEKFSRIIANDKFIGSHAVIPTTIVGIGFKEVVKAVDKSKIVNIYIDDQSWLITDNKEYFFNLHTLED